MYLQQACYGAGFDVTTYSIVFANYLHFFIVHSGNLARYFISAFLMLICINSPEGAWVHLLLHCVKDILCVYKMVVPSVWLLLYIDKGMRIHLRNAKMG